MFSYCEAYAQSVSCSAKDVKNIAVSNVTLSEGCTGNGDTGIVTLDLGFSFNGQKKYDFVLAILDANNTVGDGTLDNTECLGEMATGNTGPFGDFDGDGDCYDLNASTYSFTNIQVPFQCPVNPDGTGVVNFTPFAVFGWNGNGGFNVSCQEPAGMPSVPTGTKIVLSKTTTDTNGTGRLNGSFVFTNVNANPTNSTLTTTTTNDPVTAEVWVDSPIVNGAFANGVTIAETTDPDWVVSSISCADDGGSVVGSYNLTTGTINLQSSDLPLGSTISCSFTNDAALPSPTASLTLNKVIVGGSASTNDFLLSAIGPGTLTGTSGTSGTLPVGTYVLSETSVAGYTGSVNCSGAADTFLSDGITLAAGEVVTCTFSNTFSTGSPEFSVSKVLNGASNSISSVGVLEWTITVENTGAIALTAPTIIDEITQNGGLQSPGVTLSGPSGDTGVIGSLDTGETWTYTASYSVTQANVDDGTSLVNTFTFDPFNAASKSDSTTTAIAQDPQLQIVKTHDFLTDTNNNGRADVGDVIQYSYSVNNSGNTTILNVQINDEHAGNGTLLGPSAEALLLDVLPFGDSSDLTSDDGTWTTLAPGDKVLFTASYTVTQEDLDLLQ